MTVAALSSPEQLAVGQAGVVVDDGVEVVVAERGGLLDVGLGAIAGDRVPGASEARVALDVHVQQVTRARPLIATHLPARRTRRPRAAVATQNGVHGRVRHPRLPGEQPWPPPGALPRLTDPPLGLGIGAPRRPARPAGRIERPRPRSPLLGRGLALADRPPMRRGRRHGEGGGRRPLRPALLTDQPDQLATASRSELRISVNAHPGPPLEWISRKTHTLRSGPDVPLPAHNLPGHVN